MFGDRGQEALKRLRVAVVGLGGVGSLIVEMLARSHRRVGADRRRPGRPHEPPRLVAAGRDDVGELKTDLAARNARRANPDIMLELIPARVRAPYTGSVASSSSSSTCR